MRIERLITDHGHADRCIVTSHERGWRVRQERDAFVVRDVVRTDWHKVEWDLMRFDYDHRQLSADN